MRKLMLVAVVAAVFSVACGRDEGTAGDIAGAEQPVQSHAGAKESTSPAFGWPEGPWTELAEELTEADTLDDAVAATREILARGGVATFDGERVLVDAVDPAVTLRASPLETVHLAMEARDRAHAGSLTVAELAQMLEGFGWPFPDADPESRADAPIRGVLAPEDEEAMYALEQQAREAEREARGAESRARIAAQDAQREQAMARDAALVQQLQDATLAWQKARQVASRAAPADKAAAEAALQQAADARTALIAQRRTAQEQARAEEDALRQRIAEADELASRMEAIGERIGPDYANGERLMELFAQWVRAAAENPDDPRSFTPLFLAEMARRQDAPLDLSGSRWRRVGRGEGPPVDLRGAPRSERLRLTLLEIQLFGAAMEREHRAASAAVQRPAGNRVALALADALLPAAQASTPCTDFQKMFGELGGQAVGAVESVGIGAGLERAVSAATDAGVAEAFGKALSAANIAAKLAKLASFYENQDVSVTAEPTSIHKPVGNTELVMFTARAGIGEEDRKEYERIMSEQESSIDRAARDCYEFVGLPTPTDMADIAEEAEKWLVDWELSDGSGQHAYYSLDKNDFYLVGTRRAMQLKRDSPYSARADFIVDIRPEQAHQGKVVRGYVTGIASVDAAGMPGIGTFVGALTGPLGLAEALVELAAGWYQSVVMPRAWATIEVEYHCPRPGTLHRPRSGEPVADGGAGDGPDECLFAAGEDG